MTSTPLPSIETLRKLVHLDEDTGKLYWKTRSDSEFPAVKRASSPFLAASWNQRFAGKEAFCQLTNKGYLAGKLRSRFFFAHRIVWALSSGEWPAQQIDHINRDRRDNRPSNLRQVNNRENSRNKSGSARSSTGHVGVYTTRQGSWRAVIDLGTFDTLDEAIRARALLLECAKVPHS